ncbi:hypothetical protein CKA32_006436 [Geitlerinema sp. FC II]|nr:hypothetical protein CKA32_006436 [Geitlerinema sp. FC II]
MAVKTFGSSTVQKTQPDAKLCLPPDAQKLHPPFAPRSSGGWGD